jgi:hypothetical protein
MKLKDPYPNVKGEERLSIRSRLPQSERDFLVGIRPQKGTIQTVINLFIKGLIDECRQRGITDYTRRGEFERLVVQRTTVGESSNGGSVSGQDVGHGTPSIREPIEDKPNIHADPSHGSAESLGSKETTEGKKRGKGGLKRV